MVIPPEPDARPGATRVITGAAGAQPIAAIAAVDSLSQLEGLMELGARG
jgi:hypothetical protein